MLWKHLTAAAGLAVAATDAFVVVPDISSADTDIIKALPIHDSETAVQAQTIKLDCPGCPIKVRQNDGRAAVKTDLSNHLELTFSIDTSADVDRLLVNDFELYPNAGSWYSSLRAHQVLEISEKSKEQPQPIAPSTPQLGYTLGTRPIPTEEDEQQLHLIEIDLQVVEVGYSFITGIPSIQIRLIQTPTGKLMIASLETSASTSNPAEFDEAEKAECENVFCSWRNSILKGLKSLRPSCAQKSHKHKHMTAQYRHHHTWGQLAKNVTWSILLPIGIGLVAGVFVAILGMMVGTVIVCMWRLVVRRRTPWMRRHCRRRGEHSRRKAAAKKETAVADEKAGLMESQDEDVPDLPPYKEEEDLSAESRS